jgi:hypothetical protein
MVLAIEVDVDWLGVGALLGSVNQDPGLIGRRSQSRGEDFTKGIDADARIRGLRHGSVRYGNQYPSRQDRPNGSLAEDLENRSLKS